MRIVEISDEQKSFLTLKGVIYDFTQSYNAILSSYKFSGNDIVVRSNLKVFVSLVLKQMTLLFNHGFDDNDPDIISIKEMYRNLEDILNKL
jgi:hypothetical protein